MSELKVEWTTDTVYIVLGEAELELSREETESLFVVLGQALQDQDVMKQEEKGNDQ